MMNNQAKTNVRAPRTPGSPSDWARGGGPPSPRRSGLPCFFSQLTAQPSTSCTSRPSSVSSPCSPIRFTSGRCRSDTGWPSTWAWSGRRSPEGHKEVAEKVTGGGTAKKISGTCIEGVKSIGKKK